MTIKQGLPSSWKKGASVITNPNSPTPVRIGREVFSNRYKMLGKPGHGSASTVWLCRDSWKSNKYVVLEVYIDASKTHREAPVNKHINSLQFEHEGWGLVRTMLESFEV